jgi:DNA polymerase (family 10)
MKNQALAAMFNDIADMLEIKGETPFRITAYRRAARALEAMTEDIEAIAARGGLTEIPGIGTGIAGKITEFLRTGTSAYYEDLRAQLPPGVTVLMTVPEVGPKTALLLQQRLGVSTVEALEQACLDGKVRTLPRMGAKTEENILRGIATIRRGKTRHPIGRVLPHAHELLDVIREVPGVRNLSLAGSLRRMKETIADIDVLVTSTDPARVMDAFTAFPKVKQVLGKGPTKSSVVLDIGIQADVRVVEPEAYGAALQYFTGSKEHNVKLREKAIKRGLKVNEYGVFRVPGDVRVAGATEEEVYGAVGLPWIAPELREDQGEVELAERGALPTLVEAADLKGELHLHTRWSDGTESAEEMAKAVKGLGYEYVAITDHSQSLKFAGGVTIDELRDHARAVREIADKVGIAILIGTECDILPDGTLDYPDDVLAELDVVIASIHSRFRLSKDEMTLRMIRAMENRHVDIIAHPTGRVLGRREAYELDLERVLDAAHRTGTALEVNANPDRLDLRDVQVRMAKEYGVQLAINTDAHSRYDLRNVAFGIGVARRGGLQAEDVLNTYPLPKLRAYLDER